MVVVVVKLCAAELPGEDMKFKTWQADVAVDAFYSHVQSAVRVSFRNKMLPYKELILVARMHSLAAVIH